jgi:D-sedoheptulose 7-phosphate isomerase
MPNDAFTASITEYLDKNRDVLEMVSKEVPKIVEMAEIIDTARQQGKMIFLMGNGGSGSTASHLAQDLNKAAWKPGTEKCKAICLNDNIPIVLAIANDDAYENIFVEQLKNFLSKDDVVLGISGSGNSKNILNAIDYANKNGGKTIGWSAMGGGKLSEMASLCIVVPDSTVKANPPVPDGGLDDRMQLAENFHVILMHALIVAFRRA